MSKRVFLGFKETTETPTNSYFAYANAISLTALSKLGNDERFLDCNQADVVGLALVLLDGFVSEDDDDGMSKAMLHHFIDNAEMFKSFALTTINTCRAMNVNFNNVLEEVLEKEAGE